MFKILDDLYFNKHVGKVIDYFLVHESWEQNQKDLCESLKIHQIRMREILAKLLKYEILKITRTIAKSKFYKLNESSEIVKYLRLLNLKLSFHYSSRISNNLKEEDFEKKMEKGNLKIKNHELIKIETEVKKNGK